MKLSRLLEAIEPITANRLNTGNGGQRSKNGAETYQVPTPLPEDSPLWEMPNVIITPHISGVTPNYDQRAVELFTRNLERYIEGEPLYNVIDPNLGY